MNDSIRNSTEEMTRDLAWEATKVVDMFPRMLRCTRCHRQVCPDCAGRCKNGICPDVICEECAEGDPWMACNCYASGDPARISSDDEDKTRQASGMKWI